MHLYMLTCSLQQIPLLHATSRICCCLKGPVLHAACICGCLSMCLSCIHKSRTWLQHDRICSQQGFCFHSTLTKHSMCLDAQPNPTLAHATPLSTASSVACYTSHQVVQADLKDVHTCYHGSTSCQNRHYAGSLLDQNVLPFR